MSVVNVDTRDLSLFKGSSNILYSIKLLCASIPQNESLALEEFSMYITRLKSDPIDISGLGIGIHAYIEDPGIIVTLIC